MNGWMNEWMNDKAVCRTAMSTPGLLIITVRLYYSVNWRIELHIKISLQSSGSVCFYETVEWLKHTIILHYKATLSLRLQAMLKRYWCQSPSSVYQIPISFFSKCKICLTFKTHYSLPMLIFCDMFIHLLYCHNLSYHDLLSTACNIFWF